MIRRTPPFVLFMVGATSLYVAAAVAIDLFDRLPASGVAWLRLCGAAVILLMVRRPWTRARTWNRQRWVGVAVFGVALGAMNTTYYLAIKELPLGTATAAEFIGPITVAALGVRTPRNIAALFLAAAGVLLLADASLEGSPAGFAWILVAAGCWGLYIVWGNRNAGRTDSLGDALDGLAVSLGVSVVALAPFLLPGLIAAGPTRGDLTRSLLLGFFANVVPYGLDQIVLRRVTRARFALMLAILPATAAVVGAVVLAQRPTLTDLLGIGAVIGAILVQREVTQTEGTTEPEADSIPG